MAKDLIHYEDAYTSYTPTPNGYENTVWGIVGDFTGLCPVLYSIGIGEGWKNILELGTGRGFSTTALASVAQVTDGKMVTVDRVRCNVHGPQNDHIFYYLGRTNEVNEIKTVLQCNEMYELDCLFIDANHNQDSIQSDFDNYKDLVREGGFIIFHDVCLLQQPEGEKCEGPIFWAANDFEADGYERLTLSFSNGLGILRKK